MRYSTTVGEDGLSFTDPDREVRRAAIERIKSHFPVASRFGAVVIIGLIRGIVKPGVDPAQAMDWLVEALRDCSDAARPHGIRLALEPINRYETTLVNTAAQGLELIDHLGVINFGLLLDTFHMNIEEPVIEEGIRTCGKHTYHFHVADSNRWYPGAGHLDFKSIPGSAFLHRVSRLGVWRIFTHAERTDRCATKPYFFASARVMDFIQAKSPRIGSLLLT